MQDELQIALIQSSLTWEKPAVNRANFEKLIRDISINTELIILPEMFTTGFSMTPERIDRAEGDKSVNWMCTLAAELKVALVGSISYNENGKYTNRLFFVDEDGIRAQYDKRHTFTLAGEDKVYQAGSDKLIVEYKGFKFCPMICYDLRFPVWARNTVNYDVLIFVANWPKPRISAWDTLLKARAIENMAYCIGVNRIGTDPNGHEYPGHSAVYDCLGEQLQFSDKASILYSTLNRQHIETTRSSLNFLEDRDTFNLGVK